MEEDKVDVGRKIRRLQRWLMQEMTLVWTRIIKMESWLCLGRKISRTYC